MSILRYLPSFTIPLSAAAGIYMGGLYTFITPVYIFIMLPVAEYLMGQDNSNPDPEMEEKLKQSMAYSLLLWSFVPIQYALTAYLIWNFYQGHLTGYETAGAILAVGISNGGTGITVAHELIHRSNRFEQFLGRLLLLSTLYMHFAIEHVYGHHKHVATSEDPATAQKGENFYSYWLRTVPGQYLSAWSIERKRLSKKRLRFFSFRNEMLVFLIIQSLLVISLAVFLSLSTVLVFIASSVVAFTLLEAVNYLEHYGLERRMNEDRYEKVDHHHSWNSDFVISRMFLFELSRHSDHHATASRKYQVLRSFDDSPQLPTGYPGMIVLALFPPVWFRVMDPLVEKAASR